MTLYELSDEEALIAFEAIESKRIGRLCGCDYAVGYTCRRCELIQASEPQDRGESDWPWLDRVNAELAYTKAKRLMEARKQ